MRPFACLVLALAFPAAATAQERLLPDLRTAARAAPRDYDAQLALGRALLDAGRFREATQALTRAARLRRTDPAAQYEPIRVHFAEGNHQRARAACRAIERVARDSALARVCTARAFLAWNRSGRAFEELEAALAQSPDDYEALLALGDAHRLRAAVPEAEAAYRRAIAVRPGSSEPHLGLGMLYAQANRSADALAALRRAHELAPESPDVDYWLGRLQTGEPAVQHLRDAVANRPGWAPALASLGDALSASGQHQEAIGIFRQAIRADAHLASARAGLGRALMQAGNLEEAEAALNQAVQLVPNDAESATALADLFARTDRVEEAYAQYRRAADLDPQNPEPLTSAARLAVAEGRPVLAVGYLQRVLAAHPSHAPALALLGDVMRQRSDNAQARELYQRALSGTGDVDRSAIQSALRALGVR